MTPSATSPTWAACSGVPMPKPTATGTLASALVAATSSARPAGSSAALTGGADRGDDVDEAAGGGADRGRGARGAWSGRRAARGPARRRQAPRECPRPHPGVGRERSHRRRRPRRRCARTRRRRHVRAPCSSRPSRRPGPAPTPTRRSQARVASVAPPTSAASQLHGSSARRPADPRTEPPARSGQHRHRRTRQRSPAKTRGREAPHHVRHQRCPAFIPCSSKAGRDPLGLSRLARCSRPRLAGVGGSLASLPAVAPASHPPIPPRQSAQSPPPDPCHRVRSGRARRSPPRPVLQQPGDRMRGLECRDDPLQLRELGEGGERRRVGDGHVGGAAGVAQVGVLGARRPGSRARPRPSGPRGSGPPRRRAPRRASRAGRRCCRAAARRRGGRCRGPPRPPRPRSARPRRRHERGEDADRVGAAADAGDHPRPAGGPRRRAPARGPRRRSPAAGRGPAPGRAPGRRPSRSRSGSSRRWRPSRGSPR